MNKTRRRVAKARRAAANHRWNNLRLFELWCAGPAGQIIRSKCAEREDAPSERSGSNWSGALTGFCPVQGKGLVDGFCWYFRARHDHWSFSIWFRSELPELGLPAEDPAWSVGGEYDEPDGNGDASWMPYSHAWRLIERSVEGFRGVLVRGLAGMLGVEVPPAAKEAP